MPYPISTSSLRAQAPPSITNQGRKVEEDEGPLSERTSGTALAHCLTYIASDRGDTSTIPNSNIPVADNVGEHTG